MRFFFKLLALVFRLCGMKYVEKRGSSRFVWIFEKQGFALKFPIFSFCDVVRMLWKYRFYSRQTILLLLLQGERFTHLKCSISGFKSNWFEYRFFQQNRLQPFLLPTDFSFFGICNIMPLGQDILCGWYPLSQIFIDLIGVNVDTHHFSKTDNFCLYRGHLCIRDYGSLITQTEISKNWDVLNTFTSESIER